MKIAKDKAAHVVVGVVVALGALALIKLAGLFGASIASALAAVAVGVAYEVLQGIRNEGEPDPVDAAYTAVGGAAAAAAIALLLPMFERW